MDLSLQRLRESRAVDLNLHFNEGQSMKSRPREKSFGQTPSLLNLNER